MRIIVNSFSIDLYEDLDWRKSSMFVYDPDNKIIDQDLESIINYLYDEAFIKDRRINYAIFKKKAP